MSALRDPVDKRIRVFLLFEAHAIIDSCFFANNSVDWATFDISKDAMRTHGQLERLRDVSRRFEPHILDCEEPGEGYDTFIVHFHNQVIKTVNISTVETGRNGIGWCVGPLYSLRPQFDDWAVDMLARQIQKIYVYYTQVHDMDALVPFRGFYNSDEVAKLPFRPFNHRDINYLYYEVPGKTWLFAENLINSECLFRNRQKHKFMVVADPDEFLFWHSPDPGGSLERLIETLLPDNTAGLALNAVHYPLICSEKQQPASTLGSMNHTHLFQPNNAGLRCKMIVDPRRTRHSNVHDMSRVEAGFHHQLNVAPRDLYFKHIRAFFKECSDSLKAELVDDNDPDSFGAAMMNDTAWNISPC